MDSIATSQQRLATYVYWPHKLPSAIDMAAAGFYSTYTSRNPDSADCLECGLKLNAWHPRDVPLAEHARRKPDCPFIIKQEQLRNLARAKVSRPGAGMSIQPMASKAPPPKRRIIDEYPSEPDKEKYPKPQLRHAAVAAPEPNPQAFDTWLEGAKARFFEILDEPQKLPIYPYHDFSHVDPKCTLSVNYGNNDALHQALCHIYRKHGPLHLYQGGRDMVGTNWISCLRPGDLGIPAILICVAKKGSTYRPSNTKAAILSSDEYDGLYNWNKESALLSKLHNGQKEAMQSFQVDLVPADEDWEKVDGLGEDEWTNVEKDDA